MDSEDGRIEQGVPPPTNDQGHQLFSPQPSKGLERGGKFEILKNFYSKLLSVIFLDAKGGDEPVVILSNSEYNIFPLLQSLVTKDYKISAERFWQLARHSTDPPRGTWRPRIQRNQVKSLSSTRYPNSTEEWINLERKLGECSEGLLPEISVETIVLNVKEFVTNVRQVWKDQRRGRGQKRTSRDSETVATGRVVADLPAPIFHETTMTDTTTLDTQRVAPSRGKQWICSSSSSEDKALQNKVTPATLMVGGKEFTTTVATLMTVPDSFFARLIMSSTGAHDFFIDRSDEVFEDVLRYLRAKRYGECVDTLPITHEKHGLELLHREASFYNLPELANIARQRLNKKLSLIHI